MSEESLRDILLEGNAFPEEDEVLDRIAVIGGGQMGLGIAQAVSAKGLDVILVERNEESLAASLEQLSNNLDREIARWGLTESDKRAILSRIHGSTNLADLEEVKLILEAVSEDLSIKRDLFHRLDALVEPDAVFGTNTSTLSVTELAESTARPEQVIGMHFLYPVPKRALIEIVRGLKTSDETFNMVKAFGESIGKTVVEVYESPGYVTTRVVLPMLNEAMYALMEGVASAEGIDTAIRLGYDLAQGPLALSDQMGLDEVMKWLETMFRETGEMKYRPCPLLRKLVRAGHLGVKVGKGFFTYDEQGRRQSANQ